MYKIGIKNYKGAIIDPELGHGEIYFLPSSRSEDSVAAKLPRWLTEVINRAVADAYNKGRDEKIEEIKKVLEID